MIISIFFAAFLYLHAPAVQLQPLSDTTSVTATGFQVTNQNLYQQVQFPESMEEGDKSALKPYKGFTWVAGLMLLLTLVVIAFVVYKVFQRMNKGRRGDQ